jgi:hypothetical protein
MPKFSTFVNFLKENMFPMPASVKYLLTENPNNSNT